MNNAEIIFEYFPELTNKQKEQFERLGDLYTYWNAQINVISRKDMDHFYERHVLHSLGIASFIRFPDNTKILDIGTGGGFPGIPLAIMFPKAQFHLVDSIGKKIKVVTEVAKALGLENVSASHSRAEKVKDQYNFVVSRAVTALPKFMHWLNGKYLPENIHPELENGLLYLKGGDFIDELKEVAKNYQLKDLDQVFKSDFFETKKVVYIPKSR